MKRNLVLIVTALIVGGTLSNVFAQEKKPANKQRVKEIQCSQVATLLMLDDATAARFMPVYEQYLKDLRGTKPAAPVKERVKGEPAKPLTDAEVEQSIKNRFAHSRKMLDVREKYYTEFRKMLTPKQVLKIYQLERKNAHKFQTELEKRRNNRHKQVNKQNSRHSTYHNN